MMISSKIMKQVCMSTIVTLMGTSTVLAADMGQASAADVNVRAKASAEAAVVGQLDKDTEYSIIEKDGDWFKIEYAAEEVTEGYVPADAFGITKVDAVIDGMTVNIRKGATEASDVVGKLTTGDEVVVTGQNEDWCRIQYGDGDAYVSKDFITGEGIDATEKIEMAAAPVKTTPIPNVHGAVTAYAGLNVRTAPSTSADIITALDYAEEVDIISNDGAWIKIKTADGKMGYVSADYLSVRNGKRTNRSHASSAKGEQVIAYAKQFIGTPYVWGGTNLNSGVDCSGFVYSVMNHFGIHLNRTSAGMASNGVYVPKNQLQPGDLVLFSTGGGGISHVGMYAGNGQYIHSTNGKGNGVCMASLNSSYAQRTYVTARRVIR